MTDLSTFTPTQLATNYNIIAGILDRPNVKRFSDKKSAVRRTGSIVLDFIKSCDTDLAAQVEAGDVDLMQAFDQAQQILGASKTKSEPRERGDAPAAVNFLGMRVDIKSQDEQIPLKREGSIRSVALKQLLAGATLADLEKIFQEFDAKRGVVGKDSIRRSYEMIRIFAYHYGYGTKSSEDGTVITLVTE